MGWLGNLFGTEKAVDNITGKDGIASQLGGWIGGMKYTEEEKAEGNRETRSLVIEQLKALAPFKVMQRIMVTIIMAEWAILFNCALVCIMLKWDERFAQLMIFAKSEFAWLPVFGAVSLYLLGGVIPTRKS